VKKVKIHGAKTDRSRYPAERLQAEVRSQCGHKVGKPRIGAAKGVFDVPDSFFEPLPDEVLRAFAE
jgi:hypothetical protein